MPNLVSEAGKKGGGEEAAHRKRTKKGFNLSEVRKKLAVVRAAEVQRVQECCKQVLMQHADAMVSLVR